MRIACPNCSAHFDVPDDAIPKDGRKLRCSRCQHKWHQLPITENNELAFEDKAEELPDPLETEIELTGASDGPAHDCSHLEHNIRFVCL